MLLNIKYFMLLILLPLAVILIEPQASAKKPAARPVNLSSFTAQGQLQVINLSLKADSIATNDTEPAELTASITMPFDFDDELEYKWILTENIQHVAGALSGKLSGKIQKLEAQKQYPVTISVTGFSSVENRHVIFQVSGTKNGKRITSDAIIASKKEETFEDIVHNVEKLKMEKH